MAGSCGVKHRHLPQARENLLEAMGCTSHVLSFSTCWGNQDPRETGNSMRSWFLGHLIHIFEVFLRTPPCCHGCCLNIPPHFLQLVLGFELRASGLLGGTLPLEPLCQPCLPLIITPWTTCGKVIRVGAMPSWKGNVGLVEFNLGYFSGLSSSCICSWTCNWPALKELLLKQ
jgi:hypothetical protein